ncbi:MAG: S49 family peptidase, partial [Anaerolineales bacterium]
MLSYPFYLAKYFFWLVRRLIGRFSKGPETLILTLSGDYPQIPAPPSNLILSYFRPQQISLFQLGEQFKQVVDNPRVKNVILHIRPLAMPFSRLDVLRGYVQDLKSVGKRVIAWSYQYNIDTYYLASCADEILLLTGGEVGPLGIAREYIFLADALDKIGVKAEFVQITPYKSAGDMFTKNQ